MIDSIGIYKKADKLVQTNGTRNALRIAENIGIEIFVVDYFKSLLGLYTCQFRLRSIFLNNRMDEFLTQTVAAHELGHDIYHRNLAKNDGFKEFELFRINNSTEYEANAFASHILIDTDDFIEYAHNGYDIVSIAKAMNTEVNLMLIKCQELQKIGYNLRVPMTVTGDFLKNIRA